MYLWSGARFLSFVTVCHTCISSQSIFCHFERDLRLHKLVFEDDILPDGTEVGYFVAGKVRSARIFFFPVCPCNCLLQPFRHCAENACRL